MFLTPGLCQSDRTEAGQSSQVSGLVTRAIIGVTLHSSSVRSLNKSEEERILSRIEMQHITKYRKIN